MQKWKNKCSRYYIAKKQQKKKGNWVKKKLKRFKIVAFEIFTTILSFGRSVVLRTTERVRRLSVTFVPFLQFRLIIYMSVLKKAAILFLFFLLWL